MRSDPVCHENEKALRITVFGKLAIFHEYNKKLSTVVEWHWGKYGWVNEWVYKAQITKGFT